MARTFKHVAVEQAEMFEEFEAAIHAAYFEARFPELANALPMAEEAELQAIHDQLVEDGPEPDPMGECSHCGATLFDDADIDWHETNGECVGGVNRFSDGI